MVMPFSIKVAGDVFQQKHDQCFGHIKNVIVIADDIMVIGKKQNHRDHDVALTSLLETARRNNVCLNYDKPNTRRWKSISSVKHKQPVDENQPKPKYLW